MERLSYFRPLIKGETRRRRIHIIEQITEATSEEFVYSVNALKG